jgi:TRAP transporter TAXI family solute receptor
MARATALGTATVLAAAGCFGGGGGQAVWSAAGLDSVTISGGGTTGIYYSYGGEFGTVLSDRYDLAADVLETAGSVENLENLAEGTAQVAFSAADAAADAAAGREPFTAPLPVQALARVYDDFVHLVVLESSDIGAIEDLRGRVVSLGAEGSGTELIAGRLLSVAGVDDSEFDQRALGIDESIEALRSGEIEAFFWSGGLPTPGMDDLAGQVPIRLVPLDSLVEGVRAEYGDAYRHGVVPEGTYGLLEDVSTMAVPNFLMAHADLPDDVAYAVVEALFDGRSEIAMEVPAAALLDRSIAIFTEPVDLHPGALRYYRDTKV